MKKQKHFTTEQEILDAMHFTTEQEILDAIDLAIESRDRLRAQVELDEVCNHIAITNLKDEIERFRTKASRIDSVRLPKLKNCLAQMRTEVFPFTEDKSVVL